MGLHIKSIFIKNLWQIKGDVYWELNEDVNVLVGNNGTGKSTILRLVKGMFETITTTNNDRPNYKERYSIAESKILFSDTSHYYNRAFQPSTATYINNSHTFKIDFDYLNTFDININEVAINGNALYQNSILDNLINSLREPFVRYQKNLLQKIQKLYESGITPTKEEYDTIFGKKTLFIQQINSIFRETQKSFLEDNFSFKIEEQDNEITPYELSSGEKQIFIILLKVLLQENKSCVFLLDEPEISLHLDWQRELISYIRALNENCQLIIVTHSPTIYYKGWNDKKTNIENIIFKPYYEDDKSKDIRKSVALWKELIDNYAVRFKYIETGILENMVDHNALTFDFNKSELQISYTEFEKIIDYANEKGLKFGVLIINQLCEYLYPEDNIIEIINLLKKYNITPNIQLLYTIIPKANTLEISFKIVERFNEFNLIPDIYVLNPLLVKAKSKQDIEKIEKIRMMYQIPTIKMYDDRLKLRR